jgi:5-methylcytosine-specific restriction endonuclease McrA
MRTQVLQRDSRVCQLRYQGCTDEAAEVHHVESIAALGIRREDAFYPDTCVAACAACHRIEMLRQSRAARWAKSHWPPPRHPADAAGDGEGPLGVRSLA